MDLCNAFIVLKCSWTDWKKKFKLTSLANRSGSDYRCSEELESDLASENYFPDSHKKCMRTRKHL
jgi:hypothetical protein